VDREARRVLHEHGVEDPTALGRLTDRGPDDGDECGDHGEQTDSEA